MNIDVSVSRRRALELIAGLSLGVVPVAPAAAGTEELGDCLNSVQQIKHTSDFVKVEYLSAGQYDDFSFEIEARDTKGRQWEFMCEADDGNIYEIEQEATSADNPLFKRNVKITEQQARQIATSLYPGTI